MSYLKEVSNGFNLKLMALFFMALVTMSQWGCDAKPTPTMFAPLDMDLMEKTTEMVTKKGGNLLDKIKTLKWFKRKSRRDKLCQFKWVISDPDFDRTPQYIVKAKCDDNECHKFCSPLFYHFPVQINGKKGTFWKLQRVPVAFLYDPSR